MARMSKKQYELLTQAMADGLSVVLVRDDVAGARSAKKMVEIVAQYLQADNPNFDEQLFVEEVERQAYVMAEVEAGDLHVDI